ncbi:translation initiation factor IF-2-like [Acinonyx jubatus]|uniref:Translation initiation factor IF-2-like n=1 Tax=Acinonyx jubatus TaxID=32536 RepID=A0ABM3P312_ACIJB|nr:translation initiation factor IF-2-like [Acinonyx jubatus]
MGDAAIAGQSAEGQGRWLRAPGGGTAAARSPGRRAKGFHQAADFPEEGPGSPGPASLPPTPQRERLPESVPRPPPSRCPPRPSARGPEDTEDTSRWRPEEAGGTGRAARDPELGAGAAAGRTPSADPCGASWARGRTKDAAGEGHAAARHREAAGRACAAQGLRSAPSSGAGGQAARADKATFGRRPEEVRAGAGRCPREAPSGGAGLAVAHVGSRTPPGPASRAVCVPAGSVGGGEIRAVVCVLIGFCAQNRRGGIGGRQVFTAISQTRKGRLRGGARELEPGFVLLRGSLAEPRDRSRPRGRGVPLPRPRPHLGPHARAGPVRPVGQLGSRRSWEWGRLPHLPEGRSRAPGPAGVAPCPRPTPRQRGESPHDLRLPRLPPGGAPGPLLKGARRGLPRRAPEAAATGPGPERAKAPRGL